MLFSLMYKTIIAIYSNRLCHKEHKNCLMSFFKYQVQLDPITYVCDTSSPPAI